jgi:hypothetical protein
MGFFGSVGIGSPALRRDLRGECLDVLLCSAERRASSIAVRPGNWREFLSFARRAWATVNKDDRGGKKSERDGENRRAILPRIR